MRSAVGRASACLGCAAFAHGHWTKSSLSAGPMGRVLVQPLGVPVWKWVGTEP